VHLEGKAADNRAAVDRPADLELVSQALEVAWAAQPRINRLEDHSATIDIAHRSIHDGALAFVDPLAHRIGRLHPCAVLHPASGNTRWAKLAEKMVGPEQGAGTWSPPAGRPRPPWATRSSPACGGTCDPPASGAARRWSRRRRRRRWR